MDMNLHNVVKVTSRVRQLVNSTTGGTFYVRDITAIDKNGHEINLSYFSDDKETLKIKTAKA